MTVLGLILGCRLLAIFTFMLIGLQEIKVAIAAARERYDLPENGSLKIQVLRAIYSRQPFWSHP